MWHKPVYEAEGGGAWCGCLWEETCTCESTPACQREREGQPSWRGGRREETETIIKSWVLQGDDLTCWTQPNQRIVTPLKQITSISTDVHWPAQVREAYYSCQNSLEGKNSLNSMEYHPVAFSFILIRLQISYLLAKGKIKWELKLGSRKKKKSWSNGNWY